MTDTNPVHHKSQPRLEYVIRRSRISTHKIKLFSGEEHLQSTLQTNKSISAYPSSDSLPHQQPLEINQLTSIPLRSSNDDLDTAKINKTNRKKQVGDESQRWFNRLTPNQKIILKLLLTALVIGSIAAAIIPPVYLFVIHQSVQQSSFTNFTPLICSTTTCIGKETPYRTSIVTVLYPFDYNSNDLGGYATGIPFGNPAPSYTASCYVGSFALTLSGPSSNQYIEIPYINLGQSFTIQGWIYPATYALPDYGIFSQCDSNLRCLSISLRNSRFTVSFDSMNASNITLIGATVPNTGDWTHLTVVYDAVLFQQRIYVLGQIDAVSHGIIAPFGGTSLDSVTAIGRSSSLAYGTTFFQGRIDHFTISAGTARSTYQIYNDATLLAYYPFDSSATSNDYSVNLFNGIAVDTTLISQGRHGQALYFPYNTSYFQAACFPNLEFSNPPFSFSLWVKPDTLTGGGTLVHISNLQNGNGSNCYDFLIFTPTGALVVQWLQTATIANATQGPIIPANTWTHIAVIFSSAYGIRIHINGQLSAVSQGIGLSTNGFSSPQFVTMGNSGTSGASGSLYCRNGSIPVLSGPFKGAIDDFRMYNRELNNQEICVLANI